MLPSAATQLPQSGRSLHHRTLFPFELTVCGAKLPLKAHSHLPFQETHSYGFRRRRIAILGKVYVELEPKAWHGHSSEGMWVTPLDDGLYKVTNSPFFARGTSFEDVVRVAQREGENLFLRTVCLSATCHSGLSLQSQNPMLGEYTRYGRTKLRRTYLETT
jgi:hypothetical protein